MGRQLGLGARARASAWPESREGGIRREKEGERKGKRKRKRKREKERNRERERERASERQRDLRSAVARGRQPSGAGWGGGEEKEGGVRSAEKSEEKME